MLRSSHRNETTILRKMVQSHLRNLSPGYGILDAKGEEPVYQPGGFDHLSGDRGSLQKAV